MVVVVIVVGGALLLMLLMCWFVQELGIMMMMMMMDDILLVSEPCGYSLALRGARFLCPFSVILTRLLPQLWGLPVLY